MEKLASIYKETDAMLKITQDRYKEQADKGRIPHPEFQVGDKVLLSRKNIHTDRPSEKLDYRRLGPYEITDKIGQRAYRLKLPHTMKIHNVFHVSMLEKYNPDLFDRAPIPLPPVVTAEGEEEWEVEEILDSGTKNRVFKYLVSWK